MNDISILEIDDVSVSYGELQAIHEVSIEVEEGEVVAILGANGAGKTSLLKSILNVVPIQQGKIYFKGEDLSGYDPFERVGKGLSIVPEDSDLFSSLTVEENLLMGSYPSRDARNIEKELLEEVFDLFPRLRERREQLAGTLSGGERKMCAIGRALMLDPELILFDEISLGLAPIIINDLYEKIQEICSRGISALLVEQNRERSVEVADDLYVLQAGKVTLHGEPEELSEEEIIVSYFGRGGKK